MAVKTCFRENIQKYGSDICSFALISDDGAMTVVPFTNTKSHLMNMQAQNPEHKDYYEFEPAEWFTSNGANEEFNAICKMVSLKIDNEELDFEYFRNTLFNSCVEVLEKLRSEGFFQKELGKNLLVQFNISDTDEPKKNLINWTKRLNDSTYVKRYQDYMNYQYK
ncbi:DUF4303 domain-containing protein [Algibacter sp. AS12]|uniref:DUF4303 domain-containing protein n=1 Tax=Algibacter sp. AS12 TaxID=3135773 RepID=UPI00398B828D